MSMVSASSGTSRGAATKAALLDAADRLLERDGLDAITLRAVGAIADVSRQAPYRHFADKDALLAALALRYYEELTDAMDAQAEGADDVLADIVVTFVRWAIAHPRRYKLMLSDTVLSDESGRSVRAAESAFERVEAAMSSGRDPEGQRHVDAIMLFSAVHGLLDLTISGILGPHKAPETETLARAIVDRFRWTVGAGRAPAVSS